MSNRKFGSRAIDAARWAGDRIGQVDDSVQGAFRYLLGERGRTPTKMGVFPPESHPLKVMYADAMHPIRWEMDAQSKWEKPVVVAGSRAFQAGAITGAGVGLYNLATSFGSGADEQSPQEITL